MKLSAGQACFIYGWLGAKYSITWPDIVQNPTITFDHLLKANLTLDQLFTIQPDIKQWITHEKITKSHINLLINKWDCDIINDFKLDIGDIADQKMAPETLLKLGINFQTLSDMGLTSENMRLFKHITLLGWKQLGFTRAVAQEMPESHLYWCFCMKKSDVLASL